MDRDHYGKFGFDLAKVDCSTDNEKFCVSNYKIEGFPTLLLFVDGKLVEEYPGLDESFNLMEYIKRLVAKV